MMIRENSTGLAHQHGSYVQDVRYADFAGALIGYVQDVRYADFA
ncbi:hypothetical protein MnTg03_00418 [bacterium MnTg03]|nr:hypothetical protein MnTg03_00418 [bacterium MnTg03]